MEVKGAEDDKGIVFLEFSTNKGTAKHFGGKNEALCEYSTKLKAFFSTFARARSSALSLLVTLRTHSERT